NSITNNQITDTAGTGFAINLTGGSAPTNTYLSNNTYSGTGASSINNGGTGTIYGNQLVGTGFIQRVGTDSANAFQIQNAAGSTTLLNADTSTGKLTFGVNVVATADIDISGSIATKKGADYTSTGIQADINFGDVSLVRLNPASPLTIAGIANGRDGYQLRLVNASGVTVTVNDN